MSISQFADDIAVYSYIPSLEKNIKTLEKGIKNISKRLFHLGLDLCPDRTKLIHFNKARNPPKTISININRHKITNSKSAKFLGIIFDDKLNFKEQINSVYNKCSKAMNIIKFLRGTWWGSDPETLIILHKSLISSMIDYGSIVYFPDKKYLYMKFEKLQYSAIRFALGYRISTPTIILIAESKLPLLRERTKYLRK